MTNRYTVEAWSLPLDTTSKVIHDVPFISGSFSPELLGRGRGQMTLRSDYSRLDELVDPDNDIETLCRVFQDGVLVKGASFFARRLSRSLEDRASGVVQVTGPGIADINDWARVQWFDYLDSVAATQRSFQPDWEWGADSVSGFGGGTFEDDFDGFGGSGGAELGVVGPWAPSSGDPSNKAPDADPTVSTVEVATGTFSILVNPGANHSGAQVEFKDLQPGGTYTIAGKFIEPTADGERYTAGVGPYSSFAHSNGYRWNAYAWAELDNVARNAAKNGQPGGSSDGTQQTFTLTVTLKSDQTDLKLVVLADDHGAGSPNIFYLDDWTITGPGIGVKPWTDINDNLTTFEVSSTRANSGTYSMKFDAASSGDGVKQIIENLIIGVRYNFGGFLSHEDGGAFSYRLSVVIPGTTLNSDTSVPTGAGFTELTPLSFVATTTEVTIQIKANAASPPIAYADDITFSAGRAAATYGDIRNQLLDDANVDHVAESTPFERDTLGFLDHTSYTALLDSAANAWTSPSAGGKVSYKAARGQKHSQVDTDFERMGYEHQVVLNETPDISFGLFVDGVQSGGGPFTGTITGIPSDALNDDYILLTGRSPGNSNQPFTGTGISSGDFTILYNDHDSAGAGGTLLLGYRKIDGTEPASWAFTTNNNGPVDVQIQTMKGLPGDAVVHDTFTHNEGAQNNPSVSTSAYNVPAGGVEVALIYARGNGGTNDTPDGSDWTLVRFHPATYYVQWAQRQNTTADPSRITTWSGFASSADLTIMVIVFKPPDVARVELRLYNSYDWSTRTGGVGSNLTGNNTPTIRYGNGISGGESVKTPGGANRFLGEGTDGIWDVQRDTAAIAAFGTRELYEGNTSLLALETIQDLVSNLLDERTIPTTALSVKFSPKDATSLGQVLPFRDFDIGDTVKLDLDEEFTGSKRVVRITCDFTPETAEYVVEFDDKTYASNPVKAVTEAVRRLLEEVRSLDSLKTVTSPTPVTVIPSADPAIPTVLVAPSDAADDILAVAKYECGGTDDQVEINQAIQDILDLGGGRVVLAAGNFVLSTPILCVEAATKSVTLMGMGMGATIIDLNGTALTATDAAIEMDTNAACHLRDLTITATSNVGWCLELDGVGGSIVRVSASNKSTSVTITSGAIRLTGTVIVGINAVRDCHIPSDNEGRGISAEGDEALITGNYIDGATSQVNEGAGIYVGSTANESRITENHISEDVSGPGVYFNVAVAIVLADNTIIPAAGATNAIDIVGACDDLMIHGNILDAVDDGVHVSTTATGIVLTDNKVLSAGSDGLHVESGGAVTEHGNDWGGAGVNGTTTDLHVVRLVLGVFLQDNVAASQVAVALFLEGGNRTEAIALRAGSVTGISVFTNESRTVGTLTVDVTIDGTVTGLTAVLDGTNPDQKATIQAKGTDAFTAGQRIGVKITTDAGWLPVTADITVMVEVTDD